MNLDVIIQTTLIVQQIDAIRDREILLFIICCQIFRGSVCLDTFYIAASQWNLSRKRTFFRLCFLKEIINMWTDLNISVILIFLRLHGLFSIVIWVIVSLFWNYIKAVNIRWRFIFCIISFNCVPCFLRIHRISLWNIGPYW